MFYSVLFPTEESAEKTRNQRVPDCFSDLQLDRILSAVLPDYLEFQLEEYYYTPLTDPETVLYRQEVLRELAEPEKRAAIEDVIRRIPAARTILDEVRPKLLTSGVLTGDKLKDNYLEMGRFLDTLFVYLDAVNELNASLQKLDLRSAGLRSFAAYFQEYCSLEKLSTKDFTSFADRACLAMLLNAFAL